MKNIFTYEPQVASVESGTEPSLKDIVYEYYRTHDFTLKETNKATKDYFAAIEKQFGEG